MTEDAPLLSRAPVRAAIAIAMLAALGGIFFALRGGRDDADPEAVPTRVGTVAAEAGTGPRDGNGPVKGAPAPDFALRDLDGKVVTLSELDGNVVWVNFWATWCRPCKKELPTIQKLYDEKRDGGLVVLAVNYQESDDEAREWMANAGLTVPVLLDRSGGVYDQYRLQGLPDSFFISRDGKLAALQYGEMTESKMRERLAEAGIE